MLQNKVLITGGSGYLGRAILRQARCENWNANFTIYSRDETKQFEVKRKFPEVECILGDIRDQDRLETTMVGHDYVVHTGAVKYIPEAEHNVSETLAVNLRGSENVARAAVKAGIKSVIGISTDKACAPLNTYGATKMLMERLFSEANKWGDTKFATVRYGNVVGSTGSVIPLFKRQLEEDKLLRVTDNRMTRFWLGVDEAVDLIEWASDMVNTYPGYTFISACPAMKIVDVAEAVFEMNIKNANPVFDDYVTYTGIRPGEKLHEYLFNEQEAPRVSRLENGFIMSPAINPASNSPERMQYSSEHPNSWMNVEEMIRLINDAKEILA